MLLPQLYKLVNEQIPGETSYITAEEYTVSFKVPEHDSVSAVAPVKGVKDCAVALPVLENVTDNGVTFTFVGWATKAVDDNTVTAPTVYTDSYIGDKDVTLHACLLYTSPSPRDSTSSRMPSSA